MSGRSSTEMSSAVIMAAIALRSTGSVVRFHSRRVGGRDSVVRRT
ncbi:hypothetical protein Rrhod_4254 [Rhodococcus rhodnii LMG 5362]|uniref:Uncharacterized protein n=1 Tax=Rhodococcus rhodnii LMG 5362 TaxID=1273125 RepID=R7WHE0_9NOCA|nr:hypothetical protein Rrhod_4254 [Rhodococcus rhodnii LMG 5362]